jgi:hypothetical protein
MLCAHTHKKTREGKFVLVLKHHAMNIYKEVEVKIHTFLISTRSMFLFALAPGIYWIEV